MAIRAIDLVAKRFEEEELKFSIEEGGFIRTGMSLEAGSIDIFILFDEDDTHVRLTGINFVEVPENKYDQLYKVMNDCNDEYPNVKFYIDTEHGQVTLEDDAVIQLDSCGQECLELFHNMAVVANDAYPKIMKALWS